MSATDAERLAAARMQVAQLHNALKEAVAIIEDERWPKAAITAPMRAALDASEGAGLDIIAKARVVRALQDDLGTFLAGQGGAEVKAIIRAVDDLLNAIEPRFDSPSGNGKALECATCTDQEYEEMGRPAGWRHYPSVGRWERDPSASDEGGG